MERILRNSGRSGTTFGSAGWTLDFSSGRLRCGLGSTRRPSSIGRPDATTRASGVCLPPSISSTTTPVRAPRPPIWVVRSAPIAGDGDSAWTPWLNWSASGGRWSRTGIRARFHRLMGQSPRPSRILALAARFTVLPLQAFLIASAVLLTRHDGGSWSVAGPERRISSRVSTVMAAGASLSRSGCVETDVTPSCIGRASDLDPTSDVIGCICPRGAVEPAHFGRQSVRRFET
jgi:hypothetical protein